MKKIFVVFLIIIVVVFSFTIYIFISPRNKKATQKDFLDKSQNNESYFVRSTSQGKEIGDSSSGIKFSLPQSWDIKKKSKDMVILSLSPRLYPSDNSRMKCRVVFTSGEFSINGNYSFDTLEKNIQNNLSQTYPNAEEKNYQTINVADHPAIRSDFRFGRGKYFNNFIIIDIPYKHNLSEFFGDFSNLKNKEQEEICQKELDKIIKTVSFSK